MNKLKESMDAIKFPENIESIRLRAFYKIKNHPLTKAFIEKNNMSDEEVKNNLAILNEFIKDREACVGCIDGKCKKTPRQLEMMVSFDEKTRMLNSSLCVCKYYQKIDELLHKFRDADFPMDWFQKDFVKDLISNNKLAVQRMPVLKRLAGLLKSKSDKGVYLQGESTKGKSFIMALYAKKNLELNGGTISYVSSNRLFASLLDLNFVSKQEAQSELEAYKKVDVLILDGFGSEYKSAFTRDTFLIPLLSSRLNNRKETHFTSNYSIEEIGKMYYLTSSSEPQAKQLMSLLNSIADSITIRGTYNEN